MRLLLLDMLAGDGRADRQMMEGLSSLEWQALATMARQHRLEALLNRNLEALAVWPVPAEISRRWKQVFRRSAIRALACERSVGQIATYLDSAGIPYVALKGAWLAWHAYPHPALRPLRDIDVLVPRERAADAFGLLRAHGFTPRNPSEPTIEHALQHGKHLPGLVSPTDAIGVEIHHRLLKPDPSRGGGALATDGVLAGQIMRPSQTAPIAYPAPTEMLIHIIVHAVYEHRLCNGPLVLTDIAFLLSKETVDWKRFWALADRGGWTEGCRLLLALAGQYHSLRSPHVAESPPERVVRLAGLMMLQDHAQRGRTELAAAFESAPSFTRKIGIAAQRVWPTRHALAAFAGRPADGPIAWLHYPSWLFSRMRLLTRALLAHQQRADMRRAISLRSWLDTGR